jgi:prepilin-type N-terminal cleavage/methylation domain-containing protein
VKPILHDNGRSRDDRRGFTLVELLVVILIIGLVSVLVIPTVYSAYNHRQVSEAARILQAGLVGARDTAINNGAPAGIRLLPDPVANGINSNTNALDPTRTLASNRFVPIQLAPDYSEGLVSVTGAPTFTVPNPSQYFLYHFGNGGFYPVVILPGGNPLLYLEEQVYNPTTGLRNPPTSWYWNIRIGDKIQINNTGISYTVVGPMQVANPELFVNVGDPGTVPPVQQNGPGGYIPNPEILFLINGLDDNNDGFVDNGWDGVDNDLDGIVDRVPDYTIPNVFEWVESEHWQGSLLAGSTSNVPYTITRRPVVSPGSKETALPSNVVVDLTTWNAAVPERSRLPIDRTTGYVDVLLNPNGTVLPTTVYSNPSSFGMASSFYHFWLAERGDLFDPLAQQNVPYFLPMVPSAGNNYPNPNDTAYLQSPARALTGERLLLTIYTRTGQILTNQAESFDGSTGALNGGVSKPFLEPQQGVRGDTR